jgi:very-short-patch-repair endonuclease
LRGIFIKYNIHYEENYLQKDQERDFFMEQQGLKTLRFNNLQALQSIDDVIDVIFNALDSYLLKRA